MIQGKGVPLEGPSYPKKAPFWVKPGGDPLVDGDDKGEETHELDPVKDKADLGIEKGQEVS